jgi:hypothetical protein
MQTEKTVRISLLANEGILVQLGRTKILVDGLHENDGEYFSGSSSTISHLKIIPGTASGKLCLMTSTSIRLVCRPFGSLLISVKGM